MKNIILLLLFTCSFYIVGFTQSEKRLKHEIGLKSKLGLIEQEVLLPQYNLELEYNRNIKKSKSYISVGLKYELGDFVTNRIVDTTIFYIANDDYIIDRNQLLTIPVNYMYRPVSWIILRTGLNLRISTTGHSFTFPTYYYKIDGIAPNRQFMVEYHVGLGLQGGFKKIKARFEGYYHVGLLPSDYQELGLSFGIFYQL